MKLPKEMQDDLLNRPLTCTENRVLPSTMVEGLELATAILEEINNYLSQSPVAFAVAKAELSRLNKRGTPSLSIPCPTGISICSSTSSPKKDPQTKPPTKRTKASKKPRSKKTETEILLQKAKENGIDTTGVDSDLEALRERIALFEDLLIEDPSIKEEAPKETESSETTTPKTPSRLQSLAGMAVKKELAQVSSYVSKRFDLGEDR